MKRVRIYISALEELGITFFFLVIGFLVAMRLRLPTVVGVLIAGAIIGPNGFALIKQNEVINAFADIGATLLLFVIGIEFSLSKIISFGIKALLMTITKLALSFILVYELSILFGLQTIHGIILGVLFSITSTAIFSKLIKDQTQIKKEDVALLFAVLIFEDILAVFLLSFTSSLQVGTEQTNIVLSIVKSLAALVIGYIILQNAIARIFNYISRMKSDEVLIFAAFTTAALLAFLAGLIGLQPSIGAFLAGSIISDLKEFKKIEKNILPFGLFFSSFFFLSIGMLVNFSVVLNNLSLILFLVLASMFAKFVSIALSVYALGKEGKSAIVAGLTVLPIGEFSLLIAKEATKFIPPNKFDIIGITASAVFLTSIISAILLMAKNNVQNIIFKSLNAKTKYEGKKVANHISKILKDMEPGGELFKVYVKEFKNLAIYAATFIIITGTLFLIATILENLNIVNTSNGIPLIIKISLYLGISLICAFGAFSSLDKILSKTVSTFLTTDMVHVENDKKLFYSAINISITMLLFFITPILISLLKLPAFFSHIAIIPLIISLFILWDIIRTLNKIINNGETSKKTYMKKFKKDL